MVVIKKFFRWLRCSLFHSEYTATPGYHFYDMKCRKCGREWQDHDF